MVLPRKSPALVADATVLLAGLAFAPVLFFLRHHAYTPIGFQLVVLLIAAGTAWAFARMTASRPVARALIVATVATLFVDFGFDVDTPVSWIGPTKVLAAIFLVVFALQYFLAAASTRVGAAVVVALTAAIALTPSNAAVVDAGVSVSTRTTAPVLVHVVLDEHMGIEGLNARPGTAGTAQYARDWFETRGFQVFGGVYSQDLASEFSLGRVLNLQAGELAAGTVQFTSGLFETALTRNAYFERLIDRGYALQVLQTSFVNLCQPSLSAACRTYDVWKLGTPGFGSLALGARLDIMKLLLLRQSEIWQDIRRSRAVATAKLQLISTLSTMAMLEDLQTRLRHAKRGDAFVAHVPAPHYPYVYDANCRVRPTREWLDMSDPAAPFGVMNTLEGQRLRYERYGEQIRCVLQVLDSTLRALPGDLATDAVLIVHGDHGSRITERNPSDTPVASHADYIDAYSALFAIRAPGLAAGYRADQVSLTCLFRAFADAEFSGEPEISGCSASEPVFFKRSNELVPAGTMPTLKLAD